VLKLHNMLRLAFKISLFLILTGTLCVVAVGLWVWPSLPDTGELNDFVPLAPLKVYSMDGSLMKEYGDVKRIFVPLNKTPDVMVQAILATEDRRFYQHPGVDWRGIVQAIYDLIRTGEKKGGGSTITMQVARNHYKLTRAKLFSRKIKEIFLSLKIERELSKDKILELYLNTTEFYHQAIGVGTAAQVYYGKDIEDLTLAQYAMVAGIPVRTTNNPISNPEAAISRRNLVLRRMMNVGYIDQSAYVKTIEKPVTAIRHSTPIELDALYVASMVREEIRKKYGNDAYASEGYKVYTTIRDKNQIAAKRALRDTLVLYDTKHGYRGPEHHFDLAEDSNEQNWQNLLSTYYVIGGLKPALVISRGKASITVYSNATGLIEINWNGISWARKYINERKRGPALKSTSDAFKVGDVVRIVQRRQSKSWRVTQIPNVQGALVSLNPNNGSTLALVGGFDFNRSNFNRATQAKRQPGSSFKPFIYSAALVDGYTAATLVNDAPVVFDDPSIEDTWRPENFGLKYFGPTRLREALTNSRNLVSIRILHDVGIKKTLKHVAKFGFDINELPKGLSLALGSGVVTPWQHAKAYSVLANGGYEIEPYFIECIENYKGEIVYQATPATVCSHCKTPNANSSSSLNSNDPLITDSSEETPLNIAERVVDAQNVWIISSMMQDVIKRGSGSRAHAALKRSDMAGKTGTTNDQVDTWFAGFNSSVVTISWVGFDDNSRLGPSEQGGRTAIPMWIDYMRVALENTPESFPDIPTGLVNVKIDPATGKLARADNPDAVFEVFREAYIPRQEGSALNPDIFIDEIDSKLALEQSL